ncbi:MAG: hypothetical protein C0618_03930 [Desulfuromonas sp.]|nr:MAG: hypothetical protein C0618_03930 [Desulfuromonas sp.]
MRVASSESGIALFTAMLMSLVIMAMVTGVLYFVTQSTKMSGAGKRYATAEEAAVGAVEIMQETINLVLWNGNVPSILNDADDCVENTVLDETASACETTMDLPSALGGSFSATVRFERLFTRGLPGGRMEFARSAGGAPSTAIYYRIVTEVVGPGNTTAENTALYRFSG